MAKKTKKTMTKKQRALFFQLTDLQQRISINKISGLYGSSRECYIEAKGKAKTEKSIDATASEILSNPKVAAFISSMKEDQVMEAVMNAQEMAERLTNISRTGIDDLVEWSEVDPKSDEDAPIIQSKWKIKDEAAIDPKKMSSISELSATPQGIKIKQHSPLQAMKQLADLKGYNAATEISVNKSEELTPFNAINAGEDKKDDA